MAINQLQGLVLELISTPSQMDEAHRKVPTHQFVVAEQIQLAVPRHIRPNRLREVPVNANINP